MPDEPGTWLTIYKGAGEIGGNCLELRTDGTRIVLDVGVPLIDSRGEWFDSSSLRGRSKEALLEAGILPGVPGLFQGDPRPDAILLSHAHLDHSGFLDRTQPEIPVYATEATSKMMLAGEVFANGKQIPTHRFEKLKPERPTKIGRFRATALPVDHSVAGSAALLIETGDKAILYSGDLRLHGRHPDRAERILEILNGKTIDVLLMEGTHLGSARKERVSEHDLEERISEQVRQARGLVLACFSPQHVDRLIGFIRAARAAGRTFVANAYTAFVMHLIYLQTKIPDPKVDPQVRVFYPSVFARKPSSTLHEMFRARQITLEEIRQRPSCYLMMFRPSMLDLDFQSNLPQGTTCIYSQWTGYRDRPEWQETEMSLAARGGNLVPLHTSGHILQDDLVAFVREIDPRVVIPIHTLHPDKLGDLCERVRCVDNGRPYKVE
ncbi:MAG: MBL fold metallo-hydrolase [Rhodopirellula sp.]|nr:MBL fold metallo-hydrolase [Rhodopirellula sp.]